jgi:DNA-directed RNA polymerases I and III subunit RPAC2
MLMQDSQSATFVLQNEDHTLGNSLRHMLSRDGQVELVGYTVPHPLENKMHVRIQMSRSAADTAADAFRRGLTNLRTASEIVLEEYDAAVSAYEAGNEK